MKRFTIFFCLCLSLWAVTCQAQPRIKISREPRTNGLHSADLMLVDSWLGGSNYTTRGSQISNLIPALSLVTSNTLNFQPATINGTNWGTLSTNAVVMATNGTARNLRITGGTNTDNFAVLGTLSVGSGAISDAGGGNLTFQGGIIDTWLSTSADGTNGQNFYVGSNTWFNLTTVNPSTTTNFTADFFVAESLIRLTNNVNFLISTNRQAGKVAYSSFTLESGNTNWLLAFNSNWKWLGTTNNPPTSIASNKVAVIDLKCYGSSETNIIAAYAVQP